MTSPLSDALATQIKDSGPGDRVALEEIFKIVTDRLETFSPEKMPVFLAKLVILLAKDKMPQDFSALCDIAQRDL